MKLTQLLKLSTIIGGAIFLQGCIAAALVGGGAVAKVATDPRTMGTQVDDETLELKVSDAIRKDEQIRQEARLSVVSYSNRILLIGEVPNENLKEVASSLAKGVEGVKEVFNEMRVSPKISFAQVSKDSWITTQIKSKLFVNSSVKATDVKVITENGEVFLMGNLTQDQANAAAEVARNIDGVQKVVKVISYINQ